MIAATKRLLVRSPRVEITIVIRGSVLEQALAHHYEAFSALCLQVSSVICCRVTPQQKGQLVGLVRATGHMCLAVGDGGNDVDMIQRAPVGVGIRGKEGLQAARASDYVIPNFKALKRLLLVHGHYSYMRTQLVVQYSYYKSATFCCIQLFYGFSSLFSGSSLFNSLNVTAYNALLSIPIIAFVIDKHVPFQVALENPQLYTKCAQDRGFNSRTFFRWMLGGVFQAIALSVIVVWSCRLQNNSQGLDLLSDYESLGYVAFTSLLWTQALTMTILLNNLTRRGLASIWGIHGAFFLLMVITSAFIFDPLDDLNGYWVAMVTFRDTHFWLINVLITVTLVVPLLAIKAYLANFHPTQSDGLRKAYLRQYTHRTCHCLDLRSRSQIPSVAPESALLVKSKGSINTSNSLTNEFGATSGLSLAPPSRLNGHEGVKQTGTELTQSFRPVVPNAQPGTNIMTMSTVSES